MYLDIQKGILIEDLKDEEVKGRWKSFIRKWYVMRYRSRRDFPLDPDKRRNRGELAEGWYDPATLEKARRSAAEQPSSDRPRASPDYGRAGPAEEVPTAEDDEDEDYGPMLPDPNSMREVTHSGPTIPSMQDLELKRGIHDIRSRTGEKLLTYPTETAIEDAIAAREESRQQHRSEVHSHKAATRHLEDEIAPRAEPGTRERQLEKRREAAAANRSFAEARRGASPEAAPEEELMGSGDNDLANLRREKEKEQRKKNEREIRREEILRARAAEREERIQKYREKEQETIGWLQTLAKQRFG